MLLRLDVLPYLRNSTTPAKRGVCFFVLSGSCLCLCLKPLPCSKRTASTSKDSTTCPKTWWSLTVSLSPWTRTWTHRLCLSSVTSPELTPPHRGFFLVVLFACLPVFWVVEYEAPYTQRVVQRTFKTYEEARKTAAFNKSCGTACKVYPQGH